jgi:hypothetical protein
MEKEFILATALSALSARALYLLATPFFCIYQSENRFAFGEQKYRLLALL